MEKKTLTEAQKARVRRALCKEYGKVSLKFSGDFVTVKSICGEPGEEFFSVKEYL